MIDAIVQNAFVIIMGIVITSAIGGLGGYFRKRTNCLQKVAEEVENLRKRAYRIEKALIILTKMQEDAIEKTHPELKPEWEEIVKELLDRTNGKKNEV